MNFEKLLIVFTILTIWCVKTLQFSTLLTVKYSTIITTFLESIYFPLSAFIEVKLESVMASLNGNGSPFRPKCEYENFAFGVLNR